jgi:hypothetical protein
MNDKPIPILAYGLIGITTLVISYATFLDSKAEKGKDAAGSASPQSSTSMLPNISGMNPFASQPAASTSVLPNISAMTGPAPAPAPGQVVPVQAPKIGGRSKRNRNKLKHKKTRSKAQ